MKNRINEILESKGLTPHWLAKEIGVEPKTIYKLCKNETDRITFSLLEKICIKLDVPIQDVLIIEKNED